ncbi:MAG: deoxyribodipyrimidine photo-lyase [Planctomycetota bacterium]|nr:MAG: deoxyribodipyrimidine photo-lyase [Planctomycetota bacterium]
MKNQPTIVWFRQDLRLDDNPALLAAIERGGPVIPVYIWSPREESRWSPGGAGRWWLHHSLVALDKQLRRIGSHLVVRKGNTLTNIKELVRETGANAVFWNRCYEPDVMKRDRRIENALEKPGMVVRAFNGSLLYEPWNILNKQGKPFRVFTAFWKTCLSLDEPEKPCSPPSSLPAVKKRLKSLLPKDLVLLPRLDWAAGIRSTWKVDEQFAREQLSAFIKEHLSEYQSDRDRPDLMGTSRMSPYLHWGQISPRRIWYMIAQKIKNKRGTKFRSSAHAYLRQLGWREFAYHLLYHYPHTTERPLYEAFSNFPWARNMRALRAWQRGRTGYPMVDAGMRELWHTGWMHNRVRMIVASFLVKHLLIPWQEGAKWFWDTLVDADLANNTLGWQWSAGCGADAAPYFRIFNPVTQGYKFDPEGDYVRQWIPEIGKLPNKLIHEPWTADSASLADAGVKLGRTYPRPIIDHADARERALAAYQRIKKN